MGQPFDTRKTRRPRPVTPESSTSRSKVPDIEDSEDSIKAPPPVYRPRGHRQNSGGYDGSHQYRSQSSGTQILPYGNSIPDGLYWQTSIGPAVLQAHRLRQPERCSVDGTRIFVKVGCDTQNHTTRFSGEVNKPPGENWGSSFRKSRVPPVFPDRRGSRHHSRSHRTNPEREGEYRRTKAGSGDHSKRTSREERSSATTDQGAGLTKENLEKLGMEPDTKFREIPTRPSVRVGVTSTKHKRTSGSERQTYASQPRPTTRGILNENDRATVVSEERVPPNTSDDLGHKVSRGERRQTYTKGGDTATYAEGPAVPTAYNLRSTPLQPSGDQRYRTAKTKRRSGREHPSQPSQPNRTNPRHSRPIRDPIWADDRSVTHWEKSRRKVADDTDKGCQCTVS